MTTGVYQIRNIIDNNIYIGSTTRSFNDRFYKHKYCLRQNSHHSKRLQNTYNKYGDSIIKFEPLYKCPPEYVLKLEQKCIDAFNPEYNGVKTAGHTTGYKHTEETRRILSIKNSVKRGPYPKERIENMRNGRRYLTGHSLSDEHKIKIGVAHKGMKRSEETKLNISKSLTGKSISEETKNKLRICNLGKKQTIETIEKRMVKIRGIKKAYTKRDSQCKSVYQCDTKGNIIKEWRGATDAGKELKISQGCINLAVNGKRKSAGGFIWKRKEKIYE